jgi:hypothetical protein
VVYKKKRGRKKKRGPKKKKPVVQHTYVGLKRPYHIITTNNGEQLKDIYTAVSIDVALKKLKEFQERFNKDVKFPVKFTSSHKEKTFTECDYRLMLIKKREPEDTYEGKFRNEYGKYVDCSTGNDNWIFIDELPYNVEETFWVYGYNPKCQRKTFQFIIDELITVNSDNKYFLKQIAVFKNKLLISSTDKLDMVICKNHIDSVRLYNAISDVVSEKKLKYVTFAGDINKKTYSFNIWYNKIEKLTNWTYRKINKNTTRD